ncbi:hypothetical protein BO79DRAFT_232929 [Aspergillus costaricaensis CBS 115574]|uniref:Uncharacterized protein n=1 Tax=Aspergillus costaricaensis CBS 115574 TaxID=1448317 RepID=A0ACD1I001_9EURO|nr:hypothetical protein BO79DRAFT_232929 [Aspergillus costaricaensis CBS 115574]RAK83851.1 hypothetical protein BO79DRAFT_232929 [Aspergillus costaricaensis CBS 115574]
MSIDGRAWEDFVQQPVGLIRSLGAVKPIAMINETLQMAADICSGPGDGTINGKNKHQIYSQISSHGRVNAGKEGARADESRPSGMHAGLGHGLDVHDFLSAP